MRRIIALMVCFGLFCALFTGCDSEEAYVPTGDALVMEGEDPDLNKDKDQKPQEFSLAYYAERSLNPLNCTDFTNRVLFSLIYQNLFNVGQQNNTEPILCKKWQTSPDNKTYYFYIEDNVTFSDGTRLTIDDVVATYKAATKSAFYAGRFTHVQEISKMDDGGMMIRLDTAYENLPLLMDIPILKEEEVEADTPLGTGPYALAEGLSGAHLRRVADWWCDMDILVTANTIPLVAAQNPAHIRDEFEFNDVGLVCADPCSGTYADYRCDYELWDCDNGVFLYLGFNIAFSDFFSEPEVRTAMSFAIDRERINQEYYNGFARPATLPADPQGPYYSQTLASKYTYDPMKFIDLLSGMDPLEAPLKLLVNSDDSVRLKVARDIANTLTEMGLPTKTLEYKTATYKEVYRAANFDMYLGQTRLSANMDLSPFYGGNGNLSHNGTAEQVTYSLCQEALANHGNYYNLHQKVMEDGRIIPILFGGYTVYATRGLVTNLTPSRDNIFYYSLGKTMEGTRIPTVYE